MRMVFDSERKGSCVNLYKDGKEKESLQIVDEFLGQLQMNVGRFSDMMALSDGQMVFGDEIARMRGILECLAENENFELKISKYRG